MGNGYTTGWGHSGKVNWDNVSVEGPKAPPPGLYEFTVSKANPQESSTQKPMISVQLELTRADDERNSDAVGRKVFDNWMLTEEGAFRIKNFCQATGTDLPDDISYDSVDAWCKGVEGTQGSVMLSTQKYQGKDRARVDYYGTEEPKDEAPRNGNGKAAHPPRSAAKPKRR